MTPYYTDPLVTLHLGDCLEVMPSLEAESVDAIVTDPPYGLSFMGKHWDHGVPAREFWAEMYRVAKPGAYVLAFGGTRTVHRIATNIEDAGWVIRDMLMWIYASGFPKGKANLKPAHEPIVMARKPGPLRPLAIDQCRIEGAAWSKQDGDSGAGFMTGKFMGAAGLGEPTQQGGLRESSGGRWPSNVLLSDPELFDEPNPWVVGSGATATDGVAVRHRSGGNTFGGTTPKPPMEDAGYGGGGGYSRFFRVPSRDPDMRHVRENGGSEGDYPTAYLIPKAPRHERTVNGKRGTHPTQKPVDLMRHLLKLVTPPGGVALDPFAGSGTTGVAASLEGIRSILIERESEYAEQAKGRLMATPMGLGLDVPAGTRKRNKIGVDDPTERGRKYPRRPGTSIWGQGGGTTADEEPAA